MENENWILRFTSCTLQSQWLLSQPWIQTAKYLHTRCRHHAQTQTHPLPLKFSKLGPKPSMYSQHIGKGLTEEVEGLALRNPVPRNKETCRNCKYKKKINERK